MSFGRSVFPEGLAQLAIIAGATTPAPSIGAHCWSSTLAAEMIWDGTAWRLLPLEVRPVTIATATHTVPSNASDIIFTAACTVTMPSAANYAGRELWMKNVTATAIISAASNIVPLTSTVAGTAILPAVAAKWTRLVSDGTNWQTMAAN